MSLKENIYSDDQSIVVNDRHELEERHEDTLKSTDARFPYTVVNSNTYQPARVESTINARQAHVKEQPITKPDYPSTIVPASVSSADEFYETSPVLEEEQIYFPTLLDETNYPVVHVPVQPHMTRPLDKFSDLNLKNIPIAQTPKSFPLDSQGARDQDEVALYNIIEYEMEAVEDKNSWWSPKDCWSKFVHREEDPKLTTVEKVSLSLAIHPSYRVSHFSMHWNNCGRQQEPSHPPTGTGTQPHEQCSQQDSKRVIHLSMVGNDPNFSHTPSPLVDTLVKDSSQSHFFDLELVSDR
ncbi:hypothetical protein KGF57_003438 [Candida theae]|uniref:Uncharacterized protein n=1 Tax=Candida theae TaxID=1198502 RepID=A0AAD5FXM8_9ASCO|nr:uncharacterized protein KGF57_003438 [Candida theae]KAI5955953.1 hypothetical protein KGF57_003438 [Candida theae]